MYAVDDGETLERITSHWLPLIRNTCGEEQARKPIVLVGNKVDLVEESTLTVCSKFEIH